MSEDRRLETSSDMKILIRLMTEQQARLNTVAEAIEKGNSGRTFTDLKILITIIVVLWGIAGYIVQMSFSDLKSVVMKVPVIEQRLDQHDRRLDQHDRSIDNLGRQ